MKNSGVLLNPATNDFDIKVIRDSEGRIVQGLQAGDVTKQNTAIILHMQPGELKERPTVGVGINNMSLDKDYLLYKHRIRQQLDAEGMQVKHLEITHQNIEINANYR
jgi:hypothetical protein